MKELKKELGSISVLTTEERLEYYAQHKCELPCDDLRARAMDRVRWLIEECKVKRFKNVVDIAMHDGFVTRWMVDEPGFKSLIGIEPSTDAIEKARIAIQYRLHPEKAEYICSGYETVFLTPYFYDAIVAFEFIEHITVSEIRSFLHYMNNGLKVGGIGYLCTPNIDGRWGITNPDEHHISLQSKETLEETVKETLGVELEFYKYYEKCDHLLAKWVKV